ncbi:MAG TPA: glutamate-cysteine ligase family protein [Chitinophagales bacterium]|nr:glutamate-cysteine ligase family protein [Chitinophagales bacterium]HNI53858.1 glutamate-cysteine ligase family protein [Chitinophagales bacterium]
MGQDTSNSKHTRNKHLHFVSALLEDITALEKMIADGLLESDIERIGAEQEICIVNENFSPGDNSIDLLQKIQDPQFTTELAKYNIEINLTPRTCIEGGLIAMENELLEKFIVARNHASALNSHLVIAGILPTISRKEITLDYLTPKERYHMLSKKLRDLRGRKFDLYLKGVDELHIRHDSIMFEACNTSFQVHLQISPAELVTSYNWSLAIAAPVLAISSNSPLLLGKELWSEIRIALFQQSIDTRHSIDEIREQRPRVTFGKDWIYNSITEVYKEDISRFEVLINDDIEEHALQTLNENKVPQLRALRMHNGTIYRWNRICYGITENKPHMRMECRYIPAGPTVRDEMANAAFWIGLMKAKPENVKKIWEHFDFKDVKSNFFKAARAGMESAFVWRGKTISAYDLIKNELLPLAHAGLQNCGMPEEEIYLYLGTIEKRLETRTGAQWQVQNYRRLKKEMNDADALRALTESMYTLQLQNIPVCNWPDIAVAEAVASNIAKMHTVRQLMSTDVLTVYPEDPVALVARIMEWNDINHIIVEDRKGHIHGVITSGHIMELKEKQTNLDILPVKQVMRTELHTTSPDAPIESALEIMQTHWISSLPVVSENKLMGIVTKNDMLRWMSLRDKR